jgi:hypothetical protein
VGTDFVSLLFHPRNFTCHRPGCEMIFAGNAINNTDLLPARL